MTFTKAFITHDAFQGLWKWENLTIIFVSTVSDYAKWCNFVNFWKKACLPNPPAGCGVQRQLGQMHRSALLVWRIYCRKMSWSSGFNFYLFLNRTEEMVSWPVWLDQQAEVGPWTTSWIGLLHTLRYLSPPWAISISRNAFTAWHWYDFRPTSHLLPSCNIRNSMYNSLLPVSLKYTRAESMQHDSFHYLQQS